MYIFFPDCSSGRKKWHLGVRVRVMFLLKLSIVYVDNVLSVDRLFFEGDCKDGKDMILLVQSDVNQDLVKCAQYCVQDMIPARNTRFHVLFIIHLPSIAMPGCFTGFLVE
jgi:hypothetical protein